MRSTSHYLLFDLECHFFNRTSASLPRSFAGLPSARISRPRSVARLSSARTTRTYSFAKLSLALTRQPSLFFRTFVRYSHPPALFCETVARDCRSFRPDNLARPRSSARLSSARTSRTHSFAKLSLALTRQLSLFFRTFVRYNHPVVRPEGARAQVVLAQFVP